MNGEKAQSQAMGCVLMAAGAVALVIAALIWAAF